MENDDELKTLASEIMAATNMLSDHELAFRLQMEEALNASLALQPSSSNSVQQESPFSMDSVLTEDIPDFAHLKIQTLELDKFQQEIKDREQSEAEMCKISQDLSRSIHDQNFAREILMFPEEDWEDEGDYFEKPFGEGSSSSSASSSSNLVSDGPFRLYFKGLVTEENVKGSVIAFASIGAAICDPSDNLILKVQKPLKGEWKSLSHRYAYVKALIEGLNGALSLKIQRIDIYCDYHPLFQQLKGRWQVKQQNLKILMDQVVALREKFEICKIILLTRNDVKFAIKLARDAIDCQITASAESSSANETCNICLEEKDIMQIFCVDGCLHRYCCSCMKQHAEVKLLHGLVPGCPHEGCQTQLIADSCKKILTPKFIEMMTLRLKEASVPVTEKLYCPYPKCSTLMSKSEVLSSNDLFGTANRSGAYKCITCHGLFCINCKVPWHRGMSCLEYKRLNPRGGEAKLKSLASQQLWRQCVKCNHMIELAEGCYHMTCRCGFEFCYTCGAEWKNKKATCNCPLWNEDNILYDDSDEEEDEEWYDEEEWDSEDDEYVNAPRRFFG